VTTGGEMSKTDYPVFTRSGDARTEVDEILGSLKEASSADERALGFHKHLFVARAGMTVVFVTDRNTPLAEALRRREGWSEPTEKSQG